jgi:hypothetical protein
MTITTNIKGPEALERALAATLATYLPDELAAVWAAWAGYDAEDGISVPLVAPRHYLPGLRDLVQELPSIVVGSELWAQTANGAEMWGSHDEHLLIIGYLSSDNQHLLDVMTKRYAVAIWEVVMKHQRLDGTIAISGIDPVDCGWSPHQKNAIAPGFTRMLGWTVVAHVEQAVSQG